MSGAGAARHGGGLVICAVGLAQIAVVLDFYSLNVALPTFARVFGLPATELHWVLTAYLLRSPGSGCSGSGRSCAGSPPASTPWSGSAWSRAPARRCSSR